MIYIYIIMALLMLALLGFIIMKIIKLRVTWNEQKSFVLDIDKKTNYLISAVNENNMKLKEIMNFIRKANNDLNNNMNKNNENLYSKLSSIQQEMFLDYIYKIAKRSMGKKEIDKKVFDEFSKILHDQRMDNRIKELLRKK